MTGSSVSVVINAFNEEQEFLFAAIESVRAQDVRPTEILVVDDGSARDYRTLLRNETDVRVITQANQGLSASRNTGLREATGTFVVFLDADDRLLPNALSSNLALFADQPDAVMVYAGYRFIDRQGRTTMVARMPLLGDDPYATMLENNCIGMHATVMYARERLVALGGFNTRYRACEDYELYLRVARTGKMVQGQSVIAEYRRHEENMSNDNAMMLRTSLAVLDEQKVHVADSAAWQQAWRTGRKRWMTFYARQSFKAVEHALHNKQSQLARSLRGIVRLLPVTRFTTVEVVVREFMSRLVGRLSKGSIDMGSLRRTAPISRHFGYDRGLPVDRRYIEDFLARHSADIRGRVLEVGDNAYTKAFGGDRVTRSEVLHVDPEAPNVTYCVDLADGNGLPSDTFDCVIATQTIHLIYDLPRVAATLHRILRPNGVLLLTVPGVSSVDRGEWGSTWYWSFTPKSLERLLNDAFAANNVNVHGYGNVLTATAFLYGLAVDELEPHEFDVTDAHYPVIVAAIARRVLPPAHAATS